MSHHRFKIDKLVVYLGREKVSGTYKITQLMPLRRRRFSISHQKRQRAARARLYKETRSRSRLHEHDNGDHQRSHLACNRKGGTPRSETDAGLANKTPLPVHPWSMTLVEFPPERDGFKLNRHPALDFWWSMIFRKPVPTFPDHALECAEISSRSLARFAIGDEIERDFFAPH